MGTVVLGYDGSPSARERTYGRGRHQLLHISEVPVLCVPALETRKRRNLR
jgi:hypothetical protein